MDAATEKSWERSSSNYKPEGSRTQVIMARREDESPEGQAGRQRLQRLETR